jgi:peroxiredoxin
LPDIDATIYQKYKAQGVIVYGLHPSGESAQQVADFVKQTGVSFPIVADQSGTLGKFAFPPGVGYPYPRDVVIGKDLKVRSIRNSFNVDEVDALVQQLLKE